MPLYDTGNRAPTAVGENALAHDQNGNRAVVATAHEVIQDHGWDAIFEIASEKYDRGEFGKAPPIVTVHKTDFP